MKLPGFLVFVCLLPLVGLSITHAAEEEKDLRYAPPEDVAKWQQLKFGMFITWGPVTLKGTEIGWSRGNNVPIEEYDNLYKQFNPQQFNADQWVKVAKDAGVRYMVFVTKHHDGFCMWDTKLNDYNIMHTPFGRDIVKELSDACAKQGILFGPYLSVCDWWHPDFPFGSPAGTTEKPNPNLDRYEQYLAKQADELTTNYGPVVTMWFDIAQGFDGVRGQHIVDVVRRNQPHIVVNNRCSTQADYDTPEQCIGKMREGRAWETCMTICQQWAWKPNDQLKSLKECLHTLIRVVGGNGNLLLNISPTPEGRIEQGQIDRLHEMGTWLGKYGKTIYDTHGGPFPRGRWGASTCAGNTIYLHILDPEQDTIVLPRLLRKIVSCEVLTGGTVTFKQTKQGTEVSVPKEHRQEIDTIVALQLDGPAVDALPPLSPSVAIGKKATASNVYDNQEAAFGPANAFDNNPATCWATSANVLQGWLEVDLGEPKKIGIATIQEVYGNRIQEFELLVKEGDGWKTIAKGTQPEDEITFPPVKAQVIRLNILKATAEPSILEFQLTPPRE